MKILLVEDEPKLAEFIKKGIEENLGFVTVANDGFIGKNLILNEEFDVLIFDVNIPKINGLDLAKQVRADKITTPILMLTAMGSIQDKLIGFESGADDYLVKPFEFSELLARLRALQRRIEYSQIQYDILKIGDLELDLNVKIARRDNKIVELTAREFGLLEYLIKNRGKVISRAEIAAKVWDIKFDTGTNTIDVYINFLRKKIDKDFSTKLIHTVVGMGYIMKEE